MNPTWAEALLGRFGGQEAVDYFNDIDGMDRLREELKSASLVAIRRAARQSSRDELRWGARTARTVTDFARVVSEYYDVTGREGSDVRHRILAHIGRVLRRTRISDGVGVAFLAPAIMLMAPTGKARQELSAVCDDFAKELPKLRAVISAARDLPQESRTFLGPGGLADLAGRPESTVNEVLRQLREWLSSHPEEAKLVVLQEVPTSDPEQHDPGTE